MIKNARVSFLLFDTMTTMCSVVVSVLPFAMFTLSLIGITYVESCIGGLLDLSRSCRNAVLLGSM